MANQSIHPYLRFAKKKSAICIAFLEFRKAEKVSARRESEHIACTMHTPKTNGIEWLKGISCCGLAKKIRNIDEKHGRENVENTSVVR